MNASELKLSAHSLSQRQWRYYTQRFVKLNNQWLGFKIKRSFDIFASGLALFLLSPFLLLVMLAIRIDSPGVIFFHQMRVGRDGKVFKMWKFRSMFKDAEQRRQAIIAEMKQRGEQIDEVRFKSENDPRITRVGRFIRKTSIDELPQLWNVFVGNMSLVGPRPPLPSEVALYTPYQRQRLSVLQGITCIWQVSGRSKIPFEQQVEMDLEYIGKQSLWMDIKILFKTVRVVLKGDGAY